MPDRNTRDLERAAAATGCREDRARLAAAQARSSRIPGLIREMERVAEGIRQVGKRLERLKKWADQHPGPAHHRLTLPWNRRDEDKNPFSQEAALRRRFRRLYREWLRESGKRELVDALLHPAPKCVPGVSACYPPEWRPGMGSTHGAPTCPAIRSIIFAPFPRYSAAFDAEYDTNNRITTRAHHRRTKLPSVAT